MARNSEYSSILRLIRNTKEKSMNLCADESGLYPDELFNRLLTKIIKQHKKRIQSKQLKNGT